MNQILSTNLNDNNNNKLNSKELYNDIDNIKKVNKINKKNEKNTNRKFFKLQFTISIIIIITAISFSIYQIYSINSKEKISQNLIGNYNIYKLYADTQTKEEENIENNLFGIIEIPKINLYYPVFSNLTEENLKVSPCKFYGTNLKDNTNICIAGHNYNNDMFFSKINQLQPGDEIYIYDTTGIKYTYQVEKNYEVNENDLSPITNYNYNEKTLTLITCNNLNNNRFVIKAKQKTF